jgi:hypothetical protein
MTFYDRELPADLELKPIAKRVYGKPFGPDNPPPGRKGAVAKITRDLKEGIIDAAVIVGSDGKGTGGLTGFLVDLAMHHKKAYASLLVKLLPMQVHGEGIARATISAVNILSIPTGTYLTKEAIARMESEPQRVDYAAQDFFTQDERPIETQEPKRGSSREALEAKLATLPYEKLLALAGIDDVDAG